ncbi:hypothetical protein [Nocardiopsis sp. FIRDI 009]|uniref:TPR repeat region-containing protein n=1 Tax=Nocardiopsis sp. FIRDI 009 TaxID=714197 RepID=UPI000E2718D3|nr:hypothetical protein [Nocardiopsis sp. FIRDI 009]
MASFDISFLARTTSANPEAIRTRAEELDTLQSRLLGRADDLDADFNDTATQFTDLMAWNIQAQSAEELQLWRDAGTAIVYASSMIEMWARYVEDFKEERSAQMSEWWEFLRTKRAEIPDKYQGQTITATYPEREGLGWFGDENKCRDIYDEVVAKVADLEERERTNYQAFEDNADEVADKLRQGPTKANVQALIDAGINSFAFYNLDPNHYTMLVDGQELTEENAEEWAEELGDYWSGEKPLDERYHELMLMMSMINANAMQAQQGGTGYREEEMDFLRAFYDSLEEANPNGNGALGFPAVMEGDHLTDEEREHALGVLGDGILALSDHRLGGGYYDLPESVRRAAESPALQSPNSTEIYMIDEWAEDAGALADLLRHTNPHLEGGTGLSSTLMLSMGLYAGGTESNFDVWLSQEDAGSLLDASTRNDDANHAILTGDFVHPNFKDENGEFIPNLVHDSAEGMLDHALTSLFTFDWDDGGESVRGLTDWIAEDAADPEDRVPPNENSEVRSELSPEEQRSAEALAALVERMEDEDFREAMFSTGHEVTGDDDVTWRDVAAGHLNPELADSWSDVFTSYMDVFANTEGLGDTDDETDYSTRWDDEQNRVYLSPDGRRHFMEIIMGDADAAQKTYNEVVYYGAETMGDFSLADGPRDHGGANSYGSLLGLVDVALENESERRSTDNTEAVNHANKVRNAVVDTIGGFAGDRNVPGVVVEVAKFLAKEALEISDNPPAGDSIDTAGDWMPQEDMQLLAITALAANDPDVMDALEELHPGAVMGEGEDRYIPLDPHEWDINEESQDAALANMYDYVDERPWVDGEGSTKSAVDNFLGTLGMAWGKW